MEVRKELKTVIAKQSEREILEFLKNNCDLLYPDRVLNSIYLDTKNFDIYKINQFEDVDTFKYRFRYYGKNSTESYFEQKFNKRGQKFKLVNKKFKYDENRASPYHHENYLLYPVTHVSFVRKYFKYKNIRITLDTNIKFKKPPTRDLNSRVINEEKIILEQKILDSRDNKIENNLLFRPGKYSKFMKSIEYLYPNV